jgi:DNA processing protein
MKAVKPAATEAEKLDRLRLIRCPRVGPATFYGLMAKYETASAALAALPDLAKRGGAKEKLIIPSRSDAERELARLAKIGAKLIGYGEADYPPLLGQLEDAPPFLSIQGSAHLFARPSAALVGARNASANGQRMAEAIARGLAEAGWLVVSGLARGIDGAAHRATLAAGGATAGVVAGGLDMIYPPEHADLQALMAEAGLVVAEMPIGTEPTARLFPRRNRVIAGLSLGVVVIEAAPQSGSLITARFAGEQGREVLAVPGSPLDPRCRGGNRLIKDGAQLVESAEDVILALSPLTRHVTEPTGSHSYHSDRDTRDEDNESLRQARVLVLSLLDPHPVAVDELRRRCHLSPGMLLTVLLELELAGRIERHSGNKVSAVFAPD